MFYARSAVVVARDLLGKELSHVTDEGETAGLIVETEAYLPDDPACHGYRGETHRTRAMFGEPGRAYIHFNYGVHWMCNVVAGKAGVGTGVLIRALEPTRGIDLMTTRRKGSGSRSHRVEQLTSGPGKLTQAMGIDNDCYSLPFWGGVLTIRDAGVIPESITVSRRIGISKGKTSPLRFHVTG
ncbi:MAG: DNA-3-methyladenine glycosylase, partial [Candidatus Poribacteria bacterium]|nr:DNA-3-methyladenine glycosylase [Candidatus Poribacteria bacterium]